MAALCVTTLLMRMEDVARGDSRGRVAGPIDLLKRIDPERDGYKGIWTLRSGVLRVEPDSDRSSHLNFPLTLGTEYDLHLVGTRKEARASLVVGLRTGPKSFAIDLGAEESAALLPLDEAVPIRCSVRKDRLIVTVGEAKVFDGTLDSTRLRLPSPWRGQDSGDSFLGTRGLFEFSRVSLAVWDGKAVDTLGQREDPKARAIREAYEEQLRSGRPTITFPGARP